VLLQDRNDLLFRYRFRFIVWSFPVDQTPGRLGSIQGGNVRQKAEALWGAPRIHGELLKLGIDAGQTISSKGGTQPDLRRLVEGGSGRRLRPCVRLQH
jgi:hypothetical protein